MTQPDAPQYHNSEIELERERERKRGRGSERERGKREERVTFSRHQLCITPPQP